MFNPIYTPCWTQSTLHPNLHGSNTSITKIIFGLSWRIPRKIKPNQNHILHYSWKGVKKKKQKQIEKNCKKKLLSFILSFFFFFPSFLIVFLFYFSPCFPWSSQSLRAFLLEVKLENFECHFLEVSVRLINKRVLARFSLGWIIYTLKSQI